MEEERSSSLMGRIATWLGSCLLALILYAASVGPVILTVRGNEPHRVLNTVYAPLIWLAKREAIGKPIRDYADWWRHLRGD